MDTDKSNETPTKKGHKMTTYHNTSEDWGDAIGSLTVADYEAQAKIFAAGETPVLITADANHVYADGDIVADADDTTQKGHKMQTLTNSYHGTSCQTRLTRDEMADIEATAAQYPWDLAPTEKATIRRIRVKLCGVMDCKCGNFWGERK